MHLAGLGDADAGDRPLLPRTPSVAVTRAWGDRLLALLAAGPVRARLRTRPFLDWAELPIVTADLPGVHEDRFVLFSGHVDSWHYGAMDNGSANATQLEVARLLAARRGRCAAACGWPSGRGTRTAATPAPAGTRTSTGTTCTSAASATSTSTRSARSARRCWRRRRRWPRRGGSGARSCARWRESNWTTSASADRATSRSGGTASLPVRLLSEQPRDDGSATATALAQLLGGGSRAGGLGWWWHTTEDTLDKIDPDHLRRDARVYAEALRRLCTDERLPFDYAAVADEFAGALARYDTAAGAGLDLSGTLALARELGARIGAADLARRDPERANALLLALGRLLIPVGYTRGGPFEHDLALGIEPLPGLADAARLGALDPASDDFRFLQTRLVRERNRVKHALRAAIRLVAAADAAG